MGPENIEASIHQYAHCRLVILRFVNSVADFYHFKIQKFGVALVLLLFDGQGPALAFGQLADIPGPFYFGNILRRRHFALLSEI
jgi:hypothetical protein